MDFEKQTYFWASSIFLHQSLESIGVINSTFFIEKRSKYLQRYWFDVNALYHPDCINQKYKQNKFCGNITYLNTVCSYAPIQLLRVNSEIFLCLNFGRLIYDPWSSENLKNLFVVRDPRGIFYDKRNKSKCTDNCLAPEKICSRMRANMRAILQYETFSPERAK